MVVVVVVVVVDVVFFFLFVFIYLFIYFIKGGNGAACRIGVQDNENTKPWKKKKQNRTISVLGVGL